MNKKDVIHFFDRLAPQWDADMIRSDTLIAKILDNAEICAGKHILDVACGTGVLIPDYLDRKVASVTAIDISPEMARIAAEKFPLPQVQVLCGDVETAQFPKKFDCIMVYNAFPHFPDPAGLIEGLSRHLVSGGTLTVAHGMSRAAIDHHHSGAASKVSIGLMHEDALADIFARHLKVAVKISNDHMYQVTGIKE